MLQDSSGYGHGMDRCFNSGSGVELLPTISIEYGVPLWESCALRIRLDQARKAKLTRANRASPGSRSLRLM